MKNNFRRNLFIGFGLSMLLLLVTSVGSFISIRKLVDSNEKVSHTQEVLDHLDKSMALLLLSQNGMRGYLISGDVSHIEEFSSAEAETNEHFNEIQRLTMDNPLQQAILREILPLRLQFFSYVKMRISEKDPQRFGSPNIGPGTVLISEITIKMDRMGKMERSLLDERTKTATDYAFYTTWLIVIASLLSIGGSIGFFIRILDDFNERVALNQELNAKDAEISNRIDAISDIAAQISTGNYKIRVEDSNSDALGVVGDSLNLMAVSLDESFTNMTNKDWITSSRVGLAQIMIGNKDLSQLSTDILSYLSKILRANAGIFYLKESDGLKVYAKYALKEGQVKEYVKSGEGLSGQALIEEKLLEIYNESPDNLQISFGMGEITPTHIMAIPVMDSKVVGVLEFATTNTFSDLQKELFNTVSFSIATAIQSAINRARVQELLEETQAQSEELKAQHTELESMNVELEAQAEKLQASEEELRVQQEELQQANQELSERSTLLEERNKEILQKSEDLERSTRYKSEFLANMSHELRTPLNSILLLGRLLSENTDENMTDEQIEFAKVILSSGNGLLGLIDEILDLSKIEAGKMELEFLEIPVSEISQAMNSIFQHLAKEKDLQFTINTENAPFIIRTDRMRLEQILKNLISNAIKFTTEGSVTMTIENDASNPNHVLFKVKDTGIGIPPEKQSMIFEAFQQADGSTKRKYGGTGLGLSISRELVRLLNGKIQLYSKVGEGSEFIISIPVMSYKTENLILKESDNIAINPIENLQKEQPISEAAKEDYYYVSDVIPEDIEDDSESIQKEDKVILIVEDDVNFAKALLDFTRKRGYKGITTVRGDYALGLAVQYKPVGILLDVQLPKKSGWQVLEELKENPITKSIPIHMMSSHKLKHQSLLKGAINFLDKPAAFEEIPEVFKRIEQIVLKESKKVLILEDNAKHAQALAYFLETHRISSEIKKELQDGMEALQNDVDCVILDMGIPGKQSYELLENIKQNPEFENLPIIVFTGKSLSLQEEVRIKKYADSIIVKTAHSYQRMLDEVSLFLHLVEEDENPKLRSQRQQSRNGLSNILDKKKALIVDDDVRNIYSLSKALEAQKMQIFTAIDGREALEELEKNPDIDVVLLDMMMPNMDGYETASKIRENADWKQLPVIAVTAKAMTGDREKCINAGASDYITKPVDTDQLLSLLRVWLYQKK